VKAPKGLMHYTLPAQESGDIKGNNQQDIILKSLKDCQKIRQDEAQFYAPAFILQKVWPAGINHWTTKALKETFAKDLSLNIFSDAEISKLRETIRTGILNGSWDMKIGEKLFIKTDDNKIVPPDSIEFSEKIELYRRGILQPPKPREIELNAQVMPSTDKLKPVRVRWKASGALKIKLYQDGELVQNNSHNSGTGEFLPSDEYETSISETTIFKIVADYGSEEVVEKETKASILSYGTTTILPIPNGGEKRGLFTVKPAIFNTEGSLNSTFTQLADFIKDYQAQGIESIEVSVTELMDYRRLSTALNLFTKVPPHIQQTARISLGKQFVNLEYQGEYKSLSAVQNTLNTLLNTKDVKADVYLKLEFKFSAPISPEGAEISHIRNILNRNPVDRLNLMAKVTY
jgi:hypothetical protein